VDEGKYEPWARITSKLATREMLEYKLQMAVCARKTKRFCEKEI